MDHNNNNMDLSSAASSCNHHPHHNQQNWLAFSLSNNSLFNSSTTSSNGHVVGNDHQENGNGNGACHEHHHHLAVVCGGPKLEDFLGVSNSNVIAHHHHHHQGNINISSNVDQMTMYGAGHHHSEQQLNNNNNFATAPGNFLQQSDHHRTSQKQLVAPPPPSPPPSTKKTVETFGQRTSIFRGVTRHRWTGRYEAHLWDNSCRREGQSRKGRQVYLGGYDKEEKAARAYDLAALKYWGPTTTTNFPVLDYEKEIEEMKNMTRQEFVASLRRKSSGFSRGASMYRGVTRHHQHGRWQARIGRVAGNKDLYLGTFSTQEEAAEAYDIAAIKFRGLNAVTNFDMSRYDVKSIASSNLPIGGASNKPKLSSESISDNKSLDGIQPSDDNNKDLSTATSDPFPSQNSTPTINFAQPIKQDQSSSLWAALGYQDPTVTITTPRNPSTDITLYQDSTTLPGTTPYNTDFQAIGNMSNNVGFFNGGGYYHDQVQSNGSTSSSTEANIDGNNGATHDALAYGNGNWVFQAAKPNLSAFQTPIFGLE